MAKLSADLDAFLQDPKRGEQISLLELQQMAGERGFGFFLALLALPSGVPVPAAGYSIPFGILLLFLALQMVLGLRQPWLPDRVQRWSVPTSFAKAVLEKGSWVLKRVEVFARPRWSWICRSHVGHRVLALAIALMAISMMIPIPGTNTLPAFSIFVIGVGLLDEDGIVASIGAALSVLGLLVTSLILTVGFNLLSYAKDFLLNKLSSGN